MTDPVATTRINLISGPRNISTALMYAFRSRDDTMVVDEPLFGAFLEKTGVDHPGRAETIAAMDTDPAAVITNTILGHYPTPIVFIKNMGHHIAAFDDWSWLLRVQNVFLTRDPAEVLASFTKNVPDPSLELTGFDGQVKLLRYLRSAGQSPPVMDASEILADPLSALRDMCERLDVPWDPAMLSWSPGPKPEDGAWAPYWYNRAWASTGFEPYVPQEAKVADHLAGLLATCRGLYEELKSVET